MALDIPGYEGLYSITKDGQVWSHKRQRFLTPYGRPGDYKTVSLQKDGKGKCLYIHRLVALTYVPNPNNYTEVNHIDEDKDHNWWTNLEWCDRKYNNNYGNRTQRAAKAKRQAVYCVELDKTFSSIGEAAKETKVNALGISPCCKGKQQTCGGYHWRYADGTK